MNISVVDRKRIAAAIHAAEAHTSGEIVCVLARSSAETGALPILMAAAVSLLLPWILVQLTAMSVYAILFIQIAAFIFLAAVLSLPRVRGALLPRRAQRFVAHRAAMEQFRARGIAHTANRTGVLIFVSLAERYARIIADEGISARVPQSAWQSAVDALIAQTRKGNIAEGFITAVDLCGKELAAHFPDSGSTRDELPDRVYVI